MPLVTLVLDRNLRNTRQIANAFQPLVLCGDPDFITEVGGAELGRRIGIRRTSTGKSTSTGTPASTE